MEFGINNFLSFNWLNRSNSQTETSEQVNNTNDVALAVDSTNAERSLEDYHTLNMPRLSEEQVQELEDKPENDWSRGILRMENKDLILYAHKTVMNNGDTLYIPFRNASYIGDERAEKEFGRLILEKADSNEQVQYAGFSNDFNFDPSV